MGVERGIKLFCRQGSLPERPVRNLVPGVEPGPELPGAMDDATETAVTPREDSLEEALLRLFPGEGDTDTLEAASEVVVTRRSSAKPICAPTERACAAWG